MKKIAIVLAAGILAACSQNPRAESPAPKAETAEPLKATRWTRGGELYLEYPALVQGQKERFAIHLRGSSTSGPSMTRPARDLGAEVSLRPIDSSRDLWSLSERPRRPCRVHGKDLTETFDVGTEWLPTPHPRKPVNRKRRPSRSQGAAGALDLVQNCGGAEACGCLLRVAADTARTGGEAAVRPRGG